ncbi:MAG TPA: beta-propeller fold lactonase family protein [bacterium]
MQRECTGLKQGGIRVAPTSPRRWLRVLVSIVALSVALSACEGDAEKETKSKTYVANHMYTQQAGFIDIQAVNNSTGELATSTGTSAGLGVIPLSIAIHPTNKFLYVVNENSGTISAYTVNKSSGALSVIAGSPFATSAGTPWVAAATPNGKFLVVAGNSGSAEVFKINGTTGALTSVVGSPFSTGSNTVSMVVHPNSKFVYLCQSNNPGTIEAYSINSSGTLTELGGSPYNTGGTNPPGIAIDAKGKYLYSANAGSNSVGIHAVDSSSGALTAISGSPFGVSGNSPQFIALDPKGRYAYLVYYTQTGSNLSAYGVDSSTGELTELANSPYQPYASLGNRYSTFVAVDPAGKYVYVASNFGSNGVDGFEVDQSTGDLSEIAGFPLTGLNTSWIAFTRKLK